VATPNEAWGSEKLEPEPEAQPEPEPEPEPAPRRSGMLRCAAWWLRADFDDLDRAHTGRRAHDDKAAAAQPQPAAVVAADADVVSLVRDSGARLPGRNQARNAKPDVIAYDLGPGDSRWMRFSCGSLAYQHLHQHHPD
jgi:hypothetical protein